MNYEILSNLIITGVHSASSMYTLQNTRAGKKNRPCWALVIKYEGETIYTSNGKKFVSDFNHIMILPKGCTYEWQCTKAGHFFIIEFESTISFPEPFCFSVKHGDKILKAFKELEYKRTLRKPMFEPESIRDVYSIILYLVQADSEKYIPNSKQQKLAPAIEYISQNYGTAITNDLLAALTGMSTVYFRKLFTSVMGTSPIMYVKQLRIEKAKEMLKSDYGSLSDIAHSLGYSSIYDFSRDFKKHVSVSPSVYAQDMSQSSHL